MEEEETKMQDEDGNDVTIPVNMGGSNPNEVEFDNLYLDMNGIVRHTVSPCCQTCSSYPGSSMYTPGGKSEFPVCAMTLVHLLSFFAGSLHRKRKAI